MARGLRLDPVVTTTMKLSLPMCALLLVTACGGDDAVARADQKNYEIVQEGSASGVTSTIQGPGETLPPLTGTNADTTTAFAIDPNAVAAASVPASYTPAPEYRAPASPAAQPAPRPQESAKRTEPEPVAPPAETASTAPMTERPVEQPQPTPPEAEAEAGPEAAEPPPPTTTDTRGQ